MASQFNINMHLFDDEKSANDALKLINDGEFIGLTGVQFTTSYTSIGFLDDRQQYYIIADDTTRKYITEETTVQIESIY